jgi:predicted nucleic acid-binding protein
MRRFLLDTGSAGDYIHRRRGVYERAREAVAEGHRVGIGLPVLILIAAIALSLGKTTVVSSDSDLTAVPGLTVENWSAP